MKASNPRHFVLFSYFYPSVSIGVPGATTGSMFTPVPVEISAYDAEVTGLDLLHKTKFTKLRQVEPTPDLLRVSEGINKLEFMLDAVIQVRKLQYYSLKEYFA